MVRLEKKQFFLLEISFLAVAQVEWKSASVAAGYDDFYQYEKLWSLWWVSKDIVIIHLQSFLVQPLAVKNNQISAEY